MKNSIEIKKDGLKKVSLTSSGSEIISIEECKKYLGKFNLSDEKLLELRNYLAGIIDKSFNLYLDDFK